MIQSTQKASFGKYSALFEEYSASIAQKSAGIWRRTERRRKGAKKYEKS